MWNYIQLLLKANIRRTQNAQIHVVGKTNDHL
jgi:hypothetical protein